MTQSTSLRKAIRRLSRLILAEIFLLLLIFLPGLIYAQPGTNDPSFNSGDLGYGHGDGIDRKVNVGLIQSDGKYVFAGEILQHNFQFPRYLARMNADGSNDTTFNNYQAFGFNSNGFILALAEQSDGKLIAAGSFTTHDGNFQGRICRFNTNGALDLTFATGTGFNSTVNAVAIQDDGKILVGGLFTGFNGTPINRIARLNSNGSLDTSFHVGAGFPSNVYTIKIQPDDKILVGGIFNTYDTNSTKGLCRLNSDGSFDSTFLVGTGFSFAVYSLALQPDKKVIVGGFYSSYNGVPSFSIERLDSSGNVDPSFLATGTAGTVQAIVVQDDGKILVGGDFTTFNLMPANRIVRLDSTGITDATFNIGSGYDAKVWTLFLQNDNRIIAGGEFTEYDRVAQDKVSRLNTDGSLDETFGIAGTGCNRSDARAIAIQPDGKYIVGGGFTKYNGTPLNRICRINPSGSIDTSFHIGTGINANWVNDIEIQADGRILVGGYFTTYQDVSQINLVRINPDGSLDTSFNQGTGFNGVVECVKMQADGKILVGGSFFSYNGISSRGIARLNPNGTLDATFQVGIGTGGTFNTVNSIIVLPDSMILMAGFFTSYNGATVNKICRLHYDGTLDTTFNAGGAGFSTATSHRIEEIALQPDGKIVAVGFFLSYNGVSRVHLCRINPDGSLDTTFYNSFTTGFSSRINAVEILPTGKIMVGGEFFSYDGNSFRSFGRLNDDGTIDNIYRNGYTVYNVNPFIYDFQLTDDNKLLMAGNFIGINTNSLTGFEDISRNRLVRFLLDPYITSLSPSNSLCKNETVIITYESNGVYDAGNVFTAQLSDASGSFDSPTVIGSISATGDGTINAVIPGSVTSGGGYRIRLVASSPATIGFDNGYDLEILNSTTYYLDADGDTYGDPLVSIEACIQPPNYVLNSGDCDDAASNINPGMAEICYNGIDDNCDGTIDEGCDISLNLKLFLQGYYLGGGTMQPVLLNQNVAGSTGAEVDTVTVEMRHALIPSILIKTTKAVIMTDGTGVATFSGKPPGSYWIAIRHRNSIPTWSSSAVTIPGSYDFTTSMLKAYANNMTDVLGEGIYSFYTGDINQDEFIDIFDFPQFDYENQNFVFFQYSSSDLNGDGFVDIFDFPVYDTNNQNFIFSIHP